MMKYNTIKLNDVANAPGISISIYLQGCPHRCTGCFNPETWDFNSGKEFTEKEMQLILDNLYANGIERTLCILGGEPLCTANSPTTTYIIKKVKEKYPQNKIYIWTGYIYEDIKNRVDLQYIFKNTNVLIDGPFIEKFKNLSLKLRGSSNQKIIELNPY